MWHTVCDKTYVKAVGQRLLSLLSYFWAIVFISAVIGIFEYFDSLLPDGPVGVQPKRDRRLGIQITGVSNFVQILSNSR